MRSRSGRRAGALAVCAFLLAACGEPIVPRSPEALYALAQQQLSNNNFSPALDTLARVVREAPDSESGRRARVLQIALLGGMARAFREVAESYLAGSQEAGAAAYAPRMRSVAMDYFGRARGRSIEMVEALDRLMREPLTAPLLMDFPPPERAEPESDALADVRQGRPMEDKERNRAEREEVQEGLAAMLARLAGAGEDVRQTPGFPQGPVAELDPAAFYLGAAQEMVAISSIYRPEALKDSRMFRLYHQRALAAAERAAELAGAQEPLQVESQRLQAHCRAVLKKL